MNREPYGYLIDDSTSFTPYFCRDAEQARNRMEAGHKVVRLYADPEDLALPGPHERMISASAQRIIRDIEAMTAIRRLRKLVQANDRATLPEVIAAVADRLNVPR